MHKPVVLAVLALASCRDAVELRYAPEPGTVLERRIELGVSMSVLEGDVQKGGEPRSEVSAPDEVWLLEDEIVAADASGPKEIERTYKTMSGVAWALIGAISEWEERADGRVLKVTPTSSEWEGEVDGLVLRLTPDFDVRTLEDPGARKAAHHVPFDLECIGLLPTRPVEAGDTWTIEAGALPLGSQVALLDAASKVEIRCRLLDLRDEGEDRLAVIAFEYDHAGRVSEQVDLEQEEWTFELSGQGELVWNVTKSRAQACTLTSERIDSGPALGNDAGTRLDHRSQLKTTNRLEMTVAEIAR